MYKAPKHQRHARMAATLSKDLKQDLGRRSLPVRVGDNFWSMYRKKRQPDCRRWLSAGWERSDPGKK